MCGIAGIFHIGTAKPVDPARVRTMTDAIAHRGPDGSGVWTAPGVGLGHRRLSIIDLEGSPQPMGYADGRFQIVFNGEIYNFQALRSELEAKGHVFATEGDTEVILAAYAQWDEACLSRLNGMFAFAIYDQADRRLFLTRDRLGVKPLFYAALSDGSVAFASELKALLVHPLLRRVPDERAVEDYLAFCAERGEGSWLFDGEGRRWLDFTSGIGVTATGHCHPKVVEAARDQVGKGSHQSE